MAAAYPGPGDWARGRAGSSRLLGKGSGAPSGLHETDSAESRGNAVLRPSTPAGELSNAIEGGSELLRGLHNREERFKVGVRG